MLRCISSRRRSRNRYFRRNASSQSRARATENGVGSASDTWVLDTIAPTVADVVAVTPDPRNTPVFTIDVVLSEPIDVSTFTYQNLALTRNGSEVTLSSAVTVSLVSGTTTTYRVGGLNTYTSSDGTYVLTVNAGGIKDLAGNVGSGSASDTWVADMEIFATA